MKTVVVVQARTGSTRLPGKVLLPLAGEPLLLRMIERLRIAATPDEIVVATSSSRNDDPIAALCDRINVPCYRGDELDLLDRHYRAAVGLQADVAVKIPSDCPLIDPRVVDEVVGFFLADPKRFDFVSNLHPPSWPDGQDVEVMTFDALETAWNEAQRPFEREHTTPYIWERPERFRIGNVTWDSGRDYSMTHRWTIDYPEDYLFLSSVFDRLYPTRGARFSVDDILTLLRDHPELPTINASLAGVNWYRHHLDELRTVDSTMTRSFDNTPNQPLRP